MHETEVVFGDPELNDDKIKAAALEGFDIYEEDDVKDDVEEVEQKELIGDAELLTPTQRDSLYKLDEAGKYAVLKIKRVSLSFSGVEDEMLGCSAHPMAKTEKYRTLFGSTTPKVKDYFLVDSKDPSSVMQIDLCGGVFGLPEFAKAPPVHTFASILEAELKEVTLNVDVVPIINEALERRMYHFTMSERKISSLSLADSYKIVRFVGHGILNRAKEGAKRAAKSAALAAGFQNPVEIDDLDPDGKIIQELCGRKQTVRDLFQKFSNMEAKLSEHFKREVVVGLCHNDLHGGNLLVDSQGLVWLIDFATVEAGKHVLMDLSKFLSACAFMYLQDSVNEEHVQSIAKILCMTPDATTDLPVALMDAVREDPVAKLFFQILVRIRHSMCLFESGPGSPRNDGTPFAIALFAWSARMQSYSEPSLHQKTRALYFAIAGVQRLLRQMGEDIGPTASTWVQAALDMWEGQKGRRLSTSVATERIAVPAYEFELEFQTYCAQAGASEAWTTDILTREKVNVMESCTELSIKFLGSLKTRLVLLPEKAKILWKKLAKVYKTFAPDLLHLEHFCGRTVVLGDGGTGKSVLTKQLLAEVAQMEVAYIHQHSAERKKTADGDNGKGTPREVLVPLRVPLVDIMRQMEEDPTLLPEPDALSDPLATWMTRKYGADSSLAQLIVQVRQSQETDDEEGSSEEGADVLGLFVLLDGLDEAAVLRTTILSYLAALLAVEPCSFPLLTSRPGIVGFAEQESLATMGFVACLMSSLSQKASRELAASIMKRSRESEARMQKVVDTVADPVYAGLAGNPLCLTLLVHVLRKTEETDKAAKVLTKTAMYQQALKLMLHVADAAKFMSRDGQADMETIRQLEALKGPKARQLFQAIAWQETCMRQRTFTLAEAEAISSDKDTFEAFRSSIFSGRLPAFTVMEGAAGKQIQLAHLSFQELLAAEFATAVLQHSHKTCRVAPYWNFLSSSSVSCQSRDRLAEQWWLTVWINVSEMLGEDCFQAWCKEVGSDERALLKTGRICLHPNQMYFAGDDAYPQASVPHLVKSYRVTWIDSRAKLLKMEETKLKKQRNMIGMERKGETASMLSELMPLEAAHWICEGVGTLACFAVDHKQWSLVKALLAAGMHHCVCAAHCESVQTLCLRNPDWTGVHLLDDIKADINFPEPDCMDAHVLRMAVRYEHEEAIRVQTPSPAAIQLADSKADFAPSLQKACAGSLELELGELDLELMHPDTGITLLMCAAAGGCPDLVAALLKGRANVKSRSSENCTALHFALDCAWGEPANACVRLLLESRADPNAKCGVTTTSRNCGIGTGFMAGCMPAMASDMTKLDLLLEHGYDVTMTSDYGLSLLFWACLASSKNPNCAAMIQRLLDLKCSFMERLDTSANTRASNQEPFGIGLNRNLYRSKSTTLFTFLASGRFHLNDTVLQNLLECYDLNNRELVQERKGAVAVTVYRIPAWDAIQQSPALYVDDTRWVEHALAKGLDLTVDWIRIETNCLISHLMESTHLSIMLSLAFLTELPAPGSYFVVFSHVLKDLPDNKKDWPFEIKHFDKYVRRLGSKTMKNAWSDWLTARRSKARLTEEE
ncbi:unnamed protein product [Symbiodinium sp. KB8]|nr:unnamed protein product [Symbiodinium sp. KB8]